MIDFKKLINEKNNRGGVMYNKKYLQKHYPEIYEIVIYFSTNNNLNDIIQIL